MSKCIQCGKKLQSLQKDFCGRICRDVYNNENTSKQAELDIFSVSMKKIEGTKNDYEQILRINPCLVVCQKIKLKKLRILFLKLLKMFKEF